MCVRSTRLFSLVWLLGLAVESAAEVEKLQTIEKQGVVVEFSVSGLNAQTLHEGGIAHVRFNAHHSQSKAPIRGAYPAAWMQPRTIENPETLETNAATCRELTQQFIGSSIFSQAAVDLNIYQVLVMNDDASVSVVDPLFGFGGSKLLHMQALASPAYDWDKTENQESVFLSLPESNAVVKMNTATWKSETLTDSLAWPKPKAITLQEDQKLLWVGNQHGVAVFRTQPFVVLKTFDFKSTAGEMVLSGDGKWLYILSEKSQQLLNEPIQKQESESNLENATSQLWVIDTRTLQLVERLSLPGRVVSMDYSEKAQMLYLSETLKGNIFAIDGRTHKQVATLSVTSGIEQLRIEPTGRWGFVVNPTNNELVIFDTAKNRIVQRAKVEQQPKEISFSDEMVYISHSASQTLLMLPLAEKSLGEEHAKIRAIDTPGGDSSLGLNPLPSGAANIVQAPGSNAVLIANYHDQAIYFYKEGMAAPMGQFNNYGHSPRAVMTIDRSLREQQQAGVYETTIKVPASGVYDVVYFMDAPRINHCFTLTVEEVKDSTTVINRSHKEIPQTVVDVTKQQLLTVGKKSDLQFNIDNWKHQHIEVNISDMSGRWRETKTMDIDATGKLSLEFVPPMRGMYQVDIADLQFNYWAE